jgi:hypothetical protein
VNNFGNKCFTYIPVVRVIIIKLTITFFLFPLISSAQDYTGIWKGQLQTSGSNIEYELVIIEDNGSLKGYALTSLHNKGIENIGLKSIEIRLKKNILLLEDQKLLYSNYSTDAKRAKLYASLTFKKDSIETLTGTFITRSLDLRSTESYTGNAFLKKQNNNFDSELLTKLQELNISNIQSFTQIGKLYKNDTIVQYEETLVVNNTDKNKGGNNKTSLEILNQHKSTINSLENDSTILLETKLKIDHINYWNTENKSTIIRNPKIIENDIQLKSIKRDLNSNIRKTEIIEEIFFDSDSLILSLYDNGEVDGDTVSIFANRKEILYKQKLSTSATKLAIPLTPFEDSLYIIMFAENLGTIPPNTGLLILQLGNERREIRFSCDMQKNAGLLLRRKRV